MVTFLGDSVWMSGVACIIAAAPVEVVVMVEGVGETDDCGRNVGDVRVLDEDAESVGEMRRSGCRAERLFCEGWGSWDW